MFGKIKNYFRKKKIDDHKTRIVITVFEDGKLITATYYPDTFDIKLESGHQFGWELNINAKNFGHDIKALYRDLGIKTEVATGIAGEDLEAGEAVYRAKKNLKLYGSVGANDKGGSKCNNNGCNCTPEERASNGGYCKNVGVFIMPDPRKAYAKGAVRPKVPKKAKYTLASKKSLRQGGNY